MFDILKEVRAEAEHELAVSQAKIAVVNSIEEKFLAKHIEETEAPCEETICEDDPCEETETVCFPNIII